MKITVDRALLTEALHKVLPVIASRTTIPVLGNVLLSVKDKKLLLMTTDLEICISCNLFGEVERDGKSKPVFEADGEGEITLPARKFGQMADSLVGENVRIEWDDALATNIVSGPTRYKMTGLDPHEFPREPEFQEDRKLTLAGMEFGKTLRKIAYAVSVDQSRYVLNGILLSVRGGNFTAVATDGRRLALVEKPLEDAANIPEGDCILPIKVCNELQHLLAAEGDVVARLSEARASFTVTAPNGNTVISTRLVDGTYPNYRQVIPAAFNNHVVVAREKLGEVLSRVCVVVTDAGGSVKFNLSKGALELSAVSSDVGEASESLEVSYDGEAVRIAFNPTFLKEPLKSLEADQLTLRFNDEFKPVVLLGDEGFLYVLMPMRN